MEAAVPPGTRCQDCSTVTATRRRAARAAAPAGPVPVAPRRDGTVRAMPGPRVLLDATAVPADRGGVGRYTDALLQALAAARRGPGRRVPGAGRRRRWPTLGVREVVVAPASTASAGPTAGLGADRPAAAGRARWGPTSCTAPTTPPRPPGGGQRRHAARRDVLHRPGRAPAGQGGHVPGRDAARGAPGGALRGAVGGHARGGGAPHRRRPRPRRRRPARRGRRTCSRPWTPPSGRGSPAASAWASGRGSRSWPRWSRARTSAALVRGWVRAFAGLHAEDPAAVPALVLAGRARLGHRPARRAGHRAGGMPLLRPGYLPYDDLPGFLSGAELVAYPSLGEGFGLPVLEGMACGAAVLTTRLLSLPEVGGDAVAYCEPDPASVADALAVLHADPRAAASGSGGRRASGRWASRGTPAPRCTSGPGTPRRQGPPVTGGTDGGREPGQHPGGPTARRMVDVVVVTYSPGETLPRFLDSLAARDVAPRPAWSWPTTAPPTGSRGRGGRRAGHGCCAAGGNLGYGTAANRGAAVGTAPWLVVANPDVEWAPGRAGRAAGRRRPPPPGGRPRPAGAGPRRPAVPVGPGPAVPRARDRARPGRLGVAAQPVDRGLPAGGRRGRASA